MSYGAFVLGFGISLTQALVATVVGAVVSFFLVGLVSIAGKRGSAPTLVLSRAPFGRVGNGLPGLVSYLLLVGWETVLVSLATLATATVFDRLGWASGDSTKVVAFVVVAAVIVAAGVLGFDAIMKHPAVADDRDDRRDRRSTSTSPSTTSTSTPRRRSPTARPRR